MTKKEIVRAVKLIPRLAPKIKPELKAAYKDFKKLGYNVVKTKGEPEKSKAVAKKFRKVLDVHCKRLAVAIQEQEPTMSRKLALSIAAFFLAGLLELIVLLIVYKVTGNERLSTYAMAVFAAPLIEEAFRIYLEVKYHAGLVFSTVISVGEVVSQLHDIVTKLNPELASVVYNTETRRIEIDTKIKKFVKSARWKLSLLTVVGELPYPEGVWLPGSSYETCPNVRTRSAPDLRLRLFRFVYTLRRSCLL